MTACTSLPANIDLTALGIYNVKDPLYGAVGDGVTDDTVAIQRAVNAAFEAGGGIVYMPSSYYLIDGGPFTPPSQAGGTDGVYPGTTPIPTDPSTGSAYVLTGLLPPNNGHPVPPEGPPTMLPNGPVLLFENVILLGDGPEQTVLLAGANIYGGLLVSPHRDVQSGAVLATVNWWATYASDLGSFPDGFFAHRVFVRRFSIDCQGKHGANAGFPSHVLSGSTPIINPAIQFAADGVTPIGRLSDAALTIHATQDCGIEDVWVYDGNVDGILLDGTQDSDAWTNGPLPQSFQQLSGGSPTFSPNTPSAPNPTGIAPAHNVPVVNGFIKNCKVDLNSPMWLAGSPSAIGGSTGRRPIQAAGCGAVVVASNRIGQRNQPSLFPSAPPNTENPPDVSPNTDTALYCPGAWHTLIAGNVLTACEDGIDADGNGDTIISDNLMYNFGAVGFRSTSTSGKSSSQTLLFGNTIFLGSDFGPFQQAIAILDTIPPIATPPAEAATATPGSLVIANNVIYGCAYNVMLDLTVLGATVIGNVFDFAGVQPWNQPNPNDAFNGPPPHPPNPASVWPAINGAAIRIGGNDIIVEGNLFRNAALPGTPNPNAVGIAFPSTFPPNVAPDTIRVLIKGNIFDATIGMPIQDASSGSDGLLGVRALDNIGINPAGGLNAALVPFPLSGATVANPYPYDCFVTISAGATSSVSSVTLNGVVTGAKIASGAQKSFLVKAGGTIAINYGITPKPTWVWVGL